MFKIINGFNNIDTSKFFTFNDEKTRGHLLRLETQLVRKSLRLKSFPTRCINELNVCKTNMDSFTIALDKLWLYERID